jgi:phosphoglycolate phosphatase
MIKNLVFDFDGTISDSKDEIVLIINKLANKYGYSKLKGEDVKFFVSKGARWLISNLKISKLKIPFLMKDVRSELSKATKNLKPFDHILEVLEQLKKKNINLGILTTNSKANVEEFLKANKIHYFDFIYHGSSLFGKDILLNKMIKKRNCLCWR